MIHRESLWLVYLVDIKVGSKELMDFCRSFTLNPV